MKVKVLKLIRKYYQYKFSIHGTVCIRNKATGVVQEFADIESVITWLSYCDTAISSSLAHKWRKKKQAIYERNVMNNVSTKLVLSEEEFSNLK